MTLRQLLKRYKPSEVVKIEFWGAETNFSRPDRYVKVKDIRKVFKKEILDKEVFAYARQTSVTGFTWIDIWLVK